MASPSSSLSQAEFGPFELLPQIVWCSDPNGANIFINREFESFTGRTREELLGYGFKHAIHPDDRERVLERWQQSWLDGHPYECEFRLRRFDGTYRWLCAQARGVLDETGLLLYWVGTCHDIHALKTAEQHERTLQRITSALSTKIEAAEVARIVTTELRAGLGALGGGVLCCQDRSAPIVVGALGHDAAAFLHWSGIRMEGGETLAQVVHGGQLVVTQALLPEPDPSSHDPLLLACVPLMFEERVIGALVVTFGDPRELPREDRALLEKVAAQTAQALERSRLWHGEQRAQGERERVMAQLSSVLGAAPVGLGFLDRQGRFVRVNEQLAAFHGVSVEAHTGRTLAEVVPQLATWAEPLIAQVQQGARALLDLEVRLPANPTSPERHCRVSFYPIPGQRDSGVDGVGLMVQDVTEQHESAQALQALNAALEGRVAERTRRWQDLNAELRALTSSLANDLEEPLRRIGSVLALIEKRVNQQLGGQLDERTRYHFSLARDETSRLSHLAGDLRHLAQLENRQLRLTPVALTPLVVQVRSDLEPISRGRHLTWRVHELSSVQGDPLLLRQVLAELLLNALEATAGRPDALIEVGCWEEPNELVVWVRNNGTGCESHLAEDPFTTGLRSEHAGHGIGLPNVRRIMGRHGGRAWAEFRSDDGATFFLAFPSTPR